MLMNDRHVRDLAVALATRVEGKVEGKVEKNVAERQAADRLAETVDAVYAFALTRKPSELERRIGVDVLVELEAAWKEEPGRALETYCHTSLNSAAFLYVD